MHCQLSSSSLVLLGMLLKLLHFIILLSYVNILAYEPSAGIVVQHDGALLNGESILEFVLDDVLDLPIDTDADDIHIRYDEYNTITYQHFYLPVFVLLLGAAFCFRLLVEDPKHPVYDDKKQQTFPGYYDFLYRLKLF